MNKDEAKQIWDQLGKIEAENPGLCGFVGTVPQRVILFLRNAKWVLQDTGNNPKVFLEWRYDKLNKLYPHKTFSVGQATYEFFHDTLEILEGRAPMPSKYDEKGNKKSEYELNYIEWLESHQIKNALNKL
jgi:hypothetical protein